MSRPLESHIFSNCVKYERLSPLIAHAFKGSTDTYLDIYIDMNSAIKALYGDKNYSPIISSYKSMTSCILNMCGHYKYYFKKYLGVDTSIYMVMGNNCSDISNKFVAEYNSSFKYKMESNKIANSIIKDNMELLNKMVPYLSNIYLIESQFETAGVIAALIEKRIQEGNSNPNLIISRDILNMQLISLYPKTAMVRPTKYNNEDRSYIIGPLNSMPIEEYWKIFNSFISKSNKVMKNIHPINTALLMAMTGYNKTNLTKIIDIIKAKEYIYNCVGDNPIKCSVKTLYEMNPELNDIVSWTVIESRFKVYDIEFHKAIFQNSIEYKLLHFVDLYDPNVIRRINDKVFYNNPIDIEKL